MYCNMCRKKINPGDYGIFHYWGDQDGEPVTGIYCSINCAMEHRKLALESIQKAKNRNM